MLVKYNKKMVDVAYKECMSKECFSLGQDKGSFIQGRGYTSYYKNPKWVCMTRHLQGCPSEGVCTKCRTLYVPGKKICGWCGAELEKYGEKID